MPYNDSYQADVAQLDTYYKLASDNSGKPGFFKYLFKYFQVLSENQVLTQAAFRFWFANAVEKYKDDEETMLEMFAPMLGANSKTEAKQKLVGMQGEQIKPSFMQLTKTYQLINDNLDNERHKEINPSYCFYKLYFQYYSIRKLDPKHFQKGLEVFSDPKEAARILKGHFTESEIAEVQETLKEPESRKSLEAVSKLVESYTIAPTEEQLAEFSQDEYADSLNFFHAEFTGWLPKHVDSLVAPINKAGEVKTLTKVRLSFPDQYPLVVEVDTGKEYPFAKRVVQSGEPFKIYKHCLGGKNKDGEQRFIYFSEIINKLNKDIADATDGEAERKPRGVAETLRRSIFSANEALGPFVELEEGRGRVKVRETVNVDDLQLQKIIEATKGRNQNSSE